MLRYRGRNNARIASLRHQTAVAALHHVADPWRSLNIARHRRYDFSADRTTRPCACGFGHSPGRSAAPAARAAPRRRPAPLRAPPTVSARWPAPHPAARPASRKTPHSQRHGSAMNSAASGAMSSTLSPFRSPQTPSGRTPSIPAPWCVAKTIVFAASRRGSGSGIQIVWRGSEGETMLLAPLWLCSFVLCSLF